MNAVNTNSGIGSISETAFLDNPNVEYTNEAYDDYVEEIELSVDVNWSREKIQLQRDIGMITAMGIIIGNIIGLVI